MAALVIAFISFKTTNRRRKSDKVIKTKQNKKTRHLPAPTRLAGLQNGHAVPACCPAFPHTTIHSTYPSRRQNLQREEEKITPTAARLASHLRVPSPSDSCP